MLSTSSAPFSLSGSVDSHWYPDYKMASPCFQTTQPEWREPNSFVSVSHLFFTTWFYFFLLGRGKRRDKLLAVWCAFVCRPILPLLQSLCLTTRSYTTNLSKSFRPLFSLLFFIHLFFFSTEFTNIYRQHMPRGKSNLTTSSRLQYPLYQDIVQYEF